MRQIGRRIRDGGQRDDRAIEGHEDRRTRLDAGGALRRDYLQNGEADGSRRLIGLHGHGQSKSCQRCKSNQQADDDPLRILLTRCAFAHDLPLKVTVLSFECRCAMGSDSNP